MQSARTGDWETFAENVGTVATVVGTAAAVSAVVIGTGGAAVPALLAVSYASTVVSTGASLTVTAMACSREGISGSKCKSSAINTGISALPGVAGRMKYGKVLNKEALRHNPLVKNITHDNKWNHMRRNNKRLDMRIHEMSDSQFNRMKWRSQSMFGGYMAMNTLGFGMTAASAISSKPSGNKKENDFGNGVKCN